MSEFAALFMIAGYCAALFVVGYGGIRVEEKKKRKEKERQQSLFTPETRQNVSRHNLVSSGH